MRGDRVQGAEGRQEGRGHREGEEPATVREAVCSGLGRPAPPLRAPGAQAPGGGVRHGVGGRGSVDSRLTGSSGGAGHRPSVRLWTRQVGQHSARRLGRCLFPVRGVLPGRRGRPRRRPGRHRGPRRPTPRPGMPAVPRVPTSGPAHREVHQGGTEVRWCRGGVERGAEPGADRRVRSRVPGWGTARRERVRIGFFPHSARGLCRK